MLATAPRACAERKTRRTGAVHRQKVAVGQLGQRDGADLARKRKAVGVHLRQLPAAQSPRRHPPAPPQRRHLTVSGRFPTLRSARSCFCGPHCELVRRALRMTGRGIRIVRSRPRARSTNSRSPWKRPVYAFGASSAVNVSDPAAARPSGHLVSHRPAVDGGRAVRRPTSSCTTVANCADLVRNNDRDGRLRYRIVCSSALPAAVIDAWCRPVDRTAAQSVHAARPPRPRLSGHADALGLV